MAVIFSTEMDTENSFIRLVNFVAGCKISATKS